MDKTFFLTFENLSFDKLISYMDSTNYLLLFLITKILPKLSEQKKNEVIYFFLNDNNNLKDY